MGRNTGEFVVSIRENKIDSRLESVKLFTDEGLVKKKTGQREADPFLCVECEPVVIDITGYNIRRHSSGSALRGREYDGCLACQETKRE
jgi:hypothetical protein